MRITILLAWSALVLAVLNYSIYAKERIEAGGRGPVAGTGAGRSALLDAGRYHAPELRHSPRCARRAPCRRGRRGHMVLRADNNKVARFLRFHSGEGLTPGEKLLRFHVLRADNLERRSLRIVPDAFLFQEGHAEHYQNARYGVFKFAGANEYLLTGLAAEDRRPITAAEQ